MEAVKSITSEDQGKTFEVPESCIGSAQDARETIKQLVEAESTRSKKRAKFNGMLNGNPPWPGLLRAKGQGDRANFTLREAEGFIAAAKTPYYALAFKNERFVLLTLDYGNADAGMLAEWAGKIATRYQYALEDWDGLDMHMQRSQFQMVAHGSGPMVWEDGTDWHSSSRMAGQLLLPDDASADIEEWDTCGCPRSYLPTVLWNKINRKSAARWWNIDACKRAIMRAAPEKLQGSFGNTWERYEEEMRKGSTGYDAKSKRVFVTDLFQKEFNNKVSHFIVLQEPEGNLEANGLMEDKDDPMAGFLFRKLGRFECFTQIVCPFLYDVGPDGQWHSIKGAGPKIFDYCSASDRLTMRALDGAMKASGVIIQAKDGKSLQEAAFTDVSGGTVIGPGYEVQQQRIAPNLESPLLIKRDLQSTLQSNTGQYRQRVSEENQEPTLGQAQLNMQQQSVLGEGDASRYCKYLDRFHRETFRRLLAMGKKLYKKNKDLAPVSPEAYDDQDKGLTPSEKGALKFYRGCVVTDGIPEQIMEFSNFCRVKASRLVGNGSAQMRQLINNELLGLIPMAAERGRTFILRSAVSGLAGETWADAIFPAYDTPQIVDSHMSLAQLENNFLRLPGGKVMVDPSQDHVVHFNSHVQDIAAHAQEMQQGQGDPHELLIHLEQTGPHTHEHLQAVAQDPTRKAQIKAMTESWLGMSKMTDQLAQQVQEMDEAAAKNKPQQAPDPALIAALAKVQGELGLKKQKMLGDMNLKAEKQAFQLREKDVSLAHSLRLKKAETLNETRRQNFALAHSTRLKTAEAVHGARLAEIEARKSETAAT